MLQKAVFIHKSGASGMRFLFPVPAKRLVLCEDELYGSHDEPKAAHTS